MSRVLVLSLVTFLIIGIPQTDEQSSNTISVSLTKQIYTNADQIVQLTQGIDSYINRLKKLQSEIKELNHEVSKLKIKINRVLNSEDKKNKQKRNKDDQKKVLMVSDEYFDNLAYISSDGSYIWKLNNVSSFWNKSGKTLVSGQFYTEGQFGYNVRLKLDNPFSKVRVRLEIMDGEFDDLLPWPFNDDVDVTLLSQEYPYHHYIAKDLLGRDTCLDRLKKRKYFVYTKLLRQISIPNPKLGQDSLIIKFQFNNGLDLNGERVFNKNIIWKVDGFYQKLRQKDYSVLNTSFYTGDFGYKLQFLLYLNGKSNNGQMELMMRISKGTFDDLLWWPFTYNVTTQVFNDNVIINFCDMGKRLADRKHLRPVMAALIYFNKSEINASYPSIIKNNCLFVKFRTRSKMTNVLTTQENRKKVNYTDLIWKIESFSSRQKKYSSVSSDVYSISPFGYCLKVVAYLNGERTAVGKFSSIFLHVVSGSYDYMLPWPFSNRVSVTILNEKYQPFFNDLSLIQINDHQSLRKPSVNHSMLVGYSRFMALSKKSIAKHVIKDNLTIRLRIWDKKLNEK